MSQSASLPNTALPGFNLPPTVAQRAAATPRVEYRKSFLFDFATGDFVTDGAGRLVECDGYRAWLQWCVKAAVTQQGVYPIYRRLFGVDYQRISTEARRSLAQALIQGGITRTLRLDPRTGSVRDFVFRWEGGRVYPSFTVAPAVGTPARVESGLGPF